MEKLEMNVLTETIATQAVDKFLKYCWNFNSVKFYTNDSDYVWAPCCMEAFDNWKHFHDKWQVKANNIGGSNALLWLWHELDSNNKSKLVNWILQNYDK